MPTYTKTGPFVNAGAPGISATFLNNEETWIAAMADAVTSQDGSGNWTATSWKGVLKSVGGAHTLTDWNFGTASANNSGVTVTHGLKNAAGVATTPTVIFCTIDNFALAESCMADTVGTTTFRLSTSAATTRTVWWIALLA